jgi:hypothetical protein
MDETEKVNEASIWLRHIADGCVVVLDELNIEEFAHALSECLSHGFTFGPIAEPVARGGWTAKADAEDAVAALVAVVDHPALGVEIGEEFVH